ncbi:MAG: TrkA family potassium uptake protein [Bacteroidia bacterium]
MKFIIIGLGNFGSSLGLQLIKDGHEVIGVDKIMSRIDLLQDKFTHLVCLEAEDEAALSQLPFAETDVVVVSIGEDIGASVTVTAILKGLRPRRIVSRAISPIHQTILEAMGIEEIIHPEAEYAQQLASRLAIKGALRSMTLDEKFDIVELNLPAPLVGKTVQEVNFRKDWNLNIVTLLRSGYKPNLLGKLMRTTQVVGVISPDTRLEQGDVLVTFGRSDDIERFSEHFSRQ